MASSFALVSEQLGLVGGILGRFGHLAGGLEAFGRTVFRVPAAYLRLALWAFLAYWAQRKMSKLRVVNSGSGFKSHTCQRSLFSLPVRRSTSAHHTKHKVSSCSTCSPTEDRFQNGLCP